MKRQRKSYWCGIASIANALEVLGIRRTQREIAKLCAVVEGTPEEDEEEDKADDVYDPGGADETEMKRALLANGLQVDENSEEDLKLACDWLYDHATYRGPVVLCVDDDEHWVTAIGVCGTHHCNALLIFDPSRNTGVEVHSANSVAARWVNADGIYYGLGVSK